MVEGGKTPILSSAELEAIGFDIAIFPGGTVRALAHAMKDYFNSLIANGTTKPFTGRMLDFRSINDLIETPDLLRHAQLYDAETIRASFTRHEVEEIRG
jgi:2-methylisocitrate lyase-like PEP mutase family enzyme